MKVLLQRVHYATISVEQKQVAHIDAGLLAYVGFGHTDTLDTAKPLIEKLLHYRVFANAQGRLDLSLKDVNGALLLVPQFTLLAQTHKGRRPDFTAAMSPQAAKALFAQVVAFAQSSWPQVQSGVFGANMQVVAQNDGPINLWLSTDAL